MKQLENTSTSFNLLFTGLIPFFQKLIPGLFQDSDWFFQGSKIHIDPFTPKIAMFILLTGCHTLHISYSSSTDFKDFPGPVVFFQVFPVLENATVRFQDFSGFPGPVRTLFLFQFESIHIYYALGGVTLSVPRQFFSWLLCFVWKPTLNFRVLAVSNTELRLRLSKNMYWFHDTFLEVKALGKVLM